MTYGSNQPRYAQGDGTSPNRGNRWCCAMKAERSADQIGLVARACSLMELVLLGVDAEVVGLKKRSLRGSGGKQRRACGRSVWGLGTTCGHCDQKSTAGI